MSERFPLLEQLRAERERNEAEITAPLRARVELLIRNIATLLERVPFLVPVVSASTRPKERRR